MKNRIMLTAGLGVVLALSACNTVSGAGKDMKSAGDAVTSAAGKK